MNKPAKRIYLCLAHMSEEGVEQFLEVANMRDMEEHCGGRRVKNC